MNHMESLRVVIRDYLRKSGIECRITRDAIEIFDNDDAIDFPAFPACIIYVRDNGSVHVIRYSSLDTDDMMQSFNLSDPHLLSDIEQRVQDMIKR